MSSMGLPVLAISVLGRAGFEEISAEHPDVAGLLARLQAGEALELSVHPVDEMIQFPMMHVDWHREAGFVVMVFEDEQSIGFYPTSDVPTGAPEIQIELGGQALEKWPRELFVPLEMAIRVCKTFIATGRQDRSVPWVANDAFAREIIWETPAQRAAWERKQRSEGKR